MIRIIDTFIRYTIRITILFSLEIREYEVTLYANLIPYHCQLHLPFIKKLNYISSECIISKKCFINLTAVHREYSDFKVLHAVAVVYVCM